MQEIWKGVKGVEDYYEVSNLGRIRSLDREVFGGKSYYFKEGRILKLSKNKYGNFFVIIQIDCEKYSKQLHRLIYETFIEDITDNDEIIHIDGNKENNIPENLKKQTKNFTPRKFKGVIQIDINGNTINEFNTITEASKKLGLYHHYIFDLCNGRYNGEKGFYFKYK